MPNTSKQSEGSKTFKTSKFKPAIAGPSHQDPLRRPALAAFSTPGFHAHNKHPSHRPLQQDVISIGSDSSPSTPAGRNSVKRHSSGISIEDLSPPSKRIKNISAEKENVLQASTFVNVDRSVQRVRKSVSEAMSMFPDLAILPVEALMNYQTSGLELFKHLSEELRAFHSGANMKKDTILIEDLRDRINRRGEAIEGFLRLKTQQQVERNIVSAPIQSVPSRGQPTKSVHREASVVITDDGHCESSRGQGSKTGEIWEDIDDIPLQHKPVSVFASTSTHNATLHSQTTTPTVTLDEEIDDRLRNVFKLTGFRQNQRGAIRATLEGKDVFILMPTGGGKSLCYQLPATCTGGKTKGVTIVVSPLVALMKDQVNSLTKKNVDALLSTSETGGDDWDRLITSRSKPSMWYLTPEKLKDSPRAGSILARLYKDGFLARFVIDEAHCISTWGQDFRDAYTSLGSLREQYPEVPIMALTATANKRTVCDIISQLQLRKDYVSFTQSFNRTNLTYTVKVKKGNPVNEIANFIHTTHKGSAGVIYCLSRASCESVAEKLRDKGLSTGYFHAGMPAAEKEQTANGWQSGRIRIIVATIAFGMGIDKANVRFVIHHDMPKTLSGYYQETGRAGRDGQPADCLMYYSGNDYFKLQNQIKKSEDATEDSKRRQEAAVKEVYEFCKKISVCRRVQLLRHFDEEFDKEDCKNGCDTCQDKRETVSRDVTTYARHALSFARQLDREKVTLIQLSNALKGSKASEIVNKGLDKFKESGSCQDLPKELVDLMLDELLFLGIITKVQTQNFSGFHTDYISVVGVAAEAFIKNNTSLIIDWRPTSPKALTKQPKQRKPAAAAEYVVSAPIRSRAKKKAVVEEDPIECYDDMYADDFDDSHFDNIPELNVATSSTLKITSTALSDSMAQASSSTIVTRAMTSSALAQLGPDPAEALYDKMLKLRDKITLLRNISNANDIFEDHVLQYLSITCPLDYNTFKQELIQAVDLDAPDANEYANDRWTKFGQQFLQLCIEHKTVAAPQAKTSNFNGNQSTSIAPQPAASTASLHSRFDYKPPPLSTASSTKPKSKFKPAIARP